MQFTLVEAREKYKVCYVNSLNKEITLKHEDGINRFKERSAQHLAHACKSEMKKKLKIKPVIKPEDEKEPVEIPLVSTEGVVNEDHKQYVCHKSIFENSLYFYTLDEVDMVEVHVDMVEVGLQQKLGTKLTI